MKLGKKKCSINDDYQNLYNATNNGTKLSKEMIQFIFVTDY